MIPFAFLFAIPPLLVIIDFINYVITGKRFNVFLIRILEFVAIIAMPILYIKIVPGSTNDCCGDSATFSPAHQLTIYTIIVICVIAYFYSSYKKKIHSPILEVLTNSILLLGFILNVVIAVQIKELFLFFYGSFSICILFILQLINNHRRFIELNINDGLTQQPWEQFAWKVLKMKSILKFPLLFILCLPILIVLSCLLLLFGQKPDSIVRAFTDTYKHGFSQLDHLCNNVKCGGHFLCSVAANGHYEIVKPIRYGSRAGNKIICNRQLLIANAFEELIEQKFPFAHQIVRRNYNKVGTIVHRYYTVFNNKLVSDAVYYLMKPLELIFLIVLYTFDSKPENRIAQQYLKNSDRILLRQRLSIN
jgi:hypothetical protein